MTPRQVQEVGDWLSAQPIAEEIQQELRRRFSGIHFTYCMDDDVVGVKPVYEHSAFNLYLVDSSEHCLSFTQDVESAAGLVVAEIDDDNL